MSTISSATIAAFLTLLTTLGVGGGGTPQLAAISGAGSGLVAHYTFEEGSGTTAGDSAGSNTGTLTNGPTWTSGKIGSGAVSFDGVNDYVSVNNSSSINPSEISISVWVNPSQITNIKRVLNKGSSYYIRIRDGGRVEFIGSIFLSSLSTIPTNTWTNITVTGSPAGHKIYINGGLDTTSATPYVSSAGNESLDIGGSLDLFQGSLDDLRIYSRALSASEISELYAYTGSGGGSTLTNGVCGSSNNVCSSGSLSDTSDTSTLYQWQCLGSGGGTTASCSQTIPSQSDTQAPSTPTSLLATAVSSSQINLSWTASTDNVGVTGYRVYRNGTLLASPTSNSYSNTSLTASTNYSYTVSAYDAAGNSSSQSSSASATTQASGVSGTCSSITQYGITWTFSTSVTCGQFVTGDWWVVGPVTVNSVSPGWDGSRNGSMIDPVPLAPQGFDSRINSNYTFSDANRTKFPVTISGNKSLLSAESLAQNKIGGAYQALKSMVVLTVLNSAPTANSFRPSFVSGTKKIWTTSDVNYSLVPNLPVPSGVTVPNVSGALDRFNPYFGPGVWGTTIIPEDNVNDVYPAYENEYSSKLSLVMMLNTPQKNEYINRLIQRGIDHYAISLVNLNQWEANGGFAVGLKWPIVFAGMLLNDSGMKSPPLYAPNIGTGSNYFKFSEDAYTYLGAPNATYPAGKPGFGIDYTTLGYTIANCSSNCMARDPAGVWDPENNPSGLGGAYRQTVSKYWVGQTLAAYIMNAKSIWNHNLYFDYVDRWLSEPQTWTDMSDEYKRNVYGYGDETGFTKAMWNLYRGSTPAPADTTAPTVPTNLLATAISSSAINISWTASTDAVGVTGYKVYRGGTQIATSVTNSYSDSSLTSSTLYSYTVSSYDAAGNNSAKSSSVSATTQSTQASTCSSVSQYGITWTFSTSVPCGQFVNGDWWVVGPVVITTITPGFQQYNFAGTNQWINGWEVNPSRNDQQGFDSRASYWTASRVPVLPYTASQNTSIVKTISLVEAGPTCQTSPYATNNGPCLDTAAVLTVLGSIPANNGATVFRPPYFGSQKTLYSSNSLRTDLLPTLSPVGNLPTLGQIKSKFERVQLDHVGVGNGIYLGAFLHPDKNMQEYGADISSDSNDAVLRLSLNDSLSSKMPALIAYVQAGIDYYHMYLGGMRWQGGGGYGNKKLAPAFFALLINDSDIQNTFKSISVARNVFAEDDSLSFRQTANNGQGKVLFGVPGSNPVCTESVYWSAIATGQSQSCKDPYGFIDGGEEPGAGYDFCCNVMSWKGESLVLRIIPSLNVIWNYDYFNQFVDRWVDTGTWTQPDPCAPYDGSISNYGITFGPNGQGGCILDSNPANGIGRFPLLHGTHKNSGYYGSVFMDNMWNAYRGGSPAPVLDTTLPTISISSPSSGATVSGSSVSISATASDNIAVIGVQFKLDGTNLGSELTTAPYSGTWNTTGVSNGTHTLTATARDLAGNTKVSNTITITVSNTAPTTTTTPTTPTSGGGGGSSSSSSSSSEGSSSSSTATPSTDTLTPTVPQKPVVTPATTTTTCKATTQLGQLVELFISLGIIKQDKVLSARSYICSLGTATTTTTSQKFTLALDIGARNTEVTALQTYLISQGLLQTKATGYFGPATAKAVGLFQQKYNIAQPGTPAYGFVGPKTRQKLNELVK